MITKTKEEQYNIHLEQNKKYKNIEMGISSSFTYRNDPKRLTFMLSRYKFVSKMFENYKSVMEIGCGDGFGTTIVASGTEKTIAIDFDPLFIQSANETRKEAINIEFRVHDILDSGVNENFNGIYSLDVFEHISKENENLFMKNIISSLDENGVLILGIPSLESQKYASEISKKGHVNCKSGIDFKNFCSKYFHNVFLFSMNDEVVHTGFYPMAHYLIVVCTNIKKVN